MTNEWKETDRVVSDSSGKADQSASRRPSPVVSLFLRIFLVVIAGISVALLAFRIMEMNQLKQEAERLQVQLEQEQRALDELQYLVDAPVDEEYIVRIAREKLGLYYPDEILYYNDLNP